MNKRRNLLASLFAGVILTTGCNTITEVGQINGVNLATHTKRAIFSPSIVSTYTYRTDQPGVIEKQTEASTPGVLGQIAAPASVAGGAALFRPSRNSTSVNSVNGSNVGNDVTSGSGLTVNQSLVPPAPRGGPLHPNAPRNNGVVPNNGGANNPNN